MAKVKKSRKVKTAAQLQAQAEQKMRDTLTGAGVPEHRVAGDKVHDFAVADFTDLKAHRKERRQVLRIVYPHIVDRWLGEGGPGFEEPQRRAVEHCRSLWAVLEPRGKADWNRIPGGQGDAGRHHHALDQLARYKSDIPAPYWRVFENVVRFDMKAGEAGSEMATSTSQQQAHAKSVVGFVASLIALWRGF